MPKFFISHPIPQEETKILIEGDDKKHLRDVLRMKPGETVTICDVTGTDHLCEIESYGEEGAVTHILSRTASNTESPYEIVIYQGLPKADKMDVIIQKCVELGGARIVPVTCTRSIVKLTDKKDIIKKIQRWNRIAYEAAKQCNRSKIPEILPPVTVKEAVQKMTQDGAAFLPWECEEQRSIRSFLNEVKNKNIPAKDKSTSPVISFLVGPEGGFDQSEIDLARQHGIITVTLGKRILRTETAAPSILAMMMYEFEL